MNLKTLLKPFRLEKVLLYLWLFRANLYRPFCAIPYEIVDDENLFNMHLALNSLSHWLKVPVLLRLEITETDIK